MKLSLWQQFSSNHSNHFTVVGQFANTDKRLQATKQLQQVLDSMLVNAEQENGNELIRGQLKNIGVTWTHEQLPDWLVPEMLDIDAFAEFLFIDNGGDSYAAPEPLGLLLDKLGSQNTATWSEFGNELNIWTCRFEILDKTKADAFEAYIQDILTMSLNDYQATEDDGIASDMWFLMWREGIEGKPIDFKRNQNHFSLENARFWFIIPHARVLNLFTAWLEAQGASNIQYSVRIDKP